MLRSGLFKFRYQEKLRSLVPPSNSWTSALFSVQLDEHLCFSGNRAEIRSWLVRRFRRGYFAIFAKVERQSAYGLVRSKALPYYRLQVTPFTELSPLGENTKLKMPH
jgi:hypothetical protein